MLFRIYPSKDTFVTDYQVNGVPSTGSNVGSSEVLQLFKIAGVSGSTTATATGSLSNILMSFDVTQFAALPSTGVSYFLRLYDVQHDSTLPSSYDAEVLPVSQSWDEGIGFDVDDFVDDGFANWVQPKTNVYWKVPGGDVLTGSVPYHFDSGFENLEVDVSTIVKSWLAGASNNGFLIRISSSLQADPHDYFIKMFSSRETGYLDRRPVLEARWDDSLKDDRNDFVFDYPSTLFLYNSVRGVATNLTGVGTGSMHVGISDASGTLLSVLGSYTGQTGIYSATFTLPTGSYSGSVFFDSWGSGSFSFMTGAFRPSAGFSTDELLPAQYFVSMPTLKPEYETTELAQLRLFVRNQDYNPAAVLTGSSLSTGLVIPKAYYRIDNDRTKETVVPFGTGSLEFTRLSYRKSGNYFTFPMNNLAPGDVYRLLFLFNIDGQSQLIDGNFKFRIKPCKI